MPGSSVTLPASSWMAKQGPLTQHMAKCTQNIPNFNIVLFPHQQLSVQAMIDQELCGIYYKTPGIRRSYSYKSLHANTDPLGSGKTIIIIALIMLQPRTPIRPVIMYNETGHTVITSGNYVRPTIIVVGASVYAQWSSILAQKTNLRVYEVYNKITLAAFNTNIIKQALINTYDVVLVRNGTATYTAFNAADQAVHQAWASLNNTTLTIDLIGGLVLAAPNYIWSRAVFDDYDTIQLKNAINMPVSLSTWVVSATNKNICKTSISTGYQEHPLRSLKYHIMCQAGKLPTVANCPILVQHSMKLYKPRFYRHYVHNVNIRILQALNEIKHDEATLELIQMINSGAISTAASAIGIVATSITDIFQSVLKNKFDDYKAILANISMLECAHKYANQHFSGIRPSAALYKMAVAKILRSDTPDFTLLPRQFEVIDYITELRQTQIVKRSELRLQIDRIRDKFQSECSICLLVPDATIFIVKCCGITICDQCLPRGARFKAATLKGICPNCLEAFKFNDLIALEPGIDIHDQLTDESLSEELLLDTQEIILRAATSGEPVLADAAVDVDAADEVEEEAANVLRLPPLIAAADPKIQRLYAICMGLPTIVEPCKLIINTSPHLKLKTDYKTHQYDKESNMMFENMIELDRPADTPIKVVLFAFYTETIQNIKKAMPFPVILLGGTPRQIEQQLQEFRTSDVRMMLINSYAHSSGLNLPFASDLVSYHSLIDGARSAQLDARIQRYGRAYSANIHELRYPGEDTFKTA